MVNARTAYPHPLCEPGYKTIPGGCGSDPPSMDLLGCFKTANFVGWKNEGGKERMFVLEQWRDCWGNAEYGGVVGKIMNAFSMEERVEAIIMMGGKEVDEVEFFRDWNSGGKGNGFEAEGLC